MVRTVARETSVLAQRRRFRTSTNTDDERMLLKRLLMVLMAILACLAAFVAFVLLSVTTYRGSCRHSTSGFETFAWVKNGKATEVQAVHDAFPSVWEHKSKFESAGVTFDNYERYVECGEDPKWTRGGDVVRLSVTPNFRFAPSAKYSDAGQVPSDWKDEPVTDYVPVGVYEEPPQYSGASHRAQPWQTAPADEYKSKKKFIESLAVDWLKNEPLDEAHLLGRWHGGLLFRSAKPGYYIYIA